MKSEENYKAAQEWYKIAKEQNNQLAIEILENHFPQLAESEDEKIRKDIISFVEQAIDAGYGIIDKERKEKWLAWLEKQKEQKPVFIPKFRVGDVVMFDGYRDKSTITEIDFDNKWYSIAENKKRCILFSEQDNWKLVEQKPVESINNKDLSKCSEDIRNFMETFCEDMPKSYWDGCADTLEWIKKNPNNQFCMQKPAEWSEEDEENLTYIKAALSAYVCIREERGNKSGQVQLDKARKWLDNRFKLLSLNSKQEWSEEDEETLNNILNDLKQDVIPDDEDIQWLKSLKERYTWKPNDDQMEALLYEVNAWDEDSINGQNLKSLYQGLKKLKGE